MSNSSDEARLGAKPPASDEGANEVQYAHRYMLPPCDCEDLEESYQPGGLHPVVIGECIANRYHIVHKLGAGSSAVVWLARDQSHDRYVALKMLNSSWSSESGARELIAYNYLQSLLPAKQQDLMVPLYDSFEIEGPNGKHLCLSLGVSGPSLSSIITRSASHQLRPDVAQLLARELTYNLNLIHKAGVIYNDFSPNNILFKLNNDVNELSIEELYEAFGQPEAFEVQASNATEDFTRTHAPTYVYPALDFTRPEALKFVNPGLTLIDFAEVRYVRGPETDAKHGVTIHYTDPESLFWNEKPVQASDVWSLACILFELRGNDTLITSGVRGAEDVKNGMIRLIGALPDDWRNRREDQLRAEAEVAGIKIIEHGERTDTPPDFDFSDFDWSGMDRQMAELDAQSRERERKSRTAVSRVISAISKLRRAVRSLFRRNSQHEPFIPPPLSIGEGLPMVSLSLEDAVKSIGKWTDWCHMTVEERMEKLVAVRQILHSLGEEPVTREECDTGQTPHAPLSGEEAVDFIDLLSSMLKWHRSDRATLDDVLKHPWFTKDYGHDTEKPWLEKYHRGYIYYVNGKRWI